MSNEKFSTGAFVFTRTRGLEPRDPADLQPLAAAHGVDPAFIPAYPGDRVAITRAITHASRGLSKEDILLRPIKRTSSEVVYGIVQEKKDESQKRLDHDFESTVAWAAEPDPSVVTGDHEVAGRVRAAYRSLRAKIVADDWSSSITSYLESHDAARMRGDGRVYWVPPQRLEEIRTLSAFLAEVGIDLILCEIEPEVRSVVQDVAQVSLDEELDRLQDEARAFDGTQKPSTYSRRLDEYDRLRQRATLYRDALGLGADRAAQVLDELERKVTEMLTLRRQTVIHRDGSASTPEKSSLPADDDAAVDVGGEGPSHDLPPLESSSEASVSSSVRVAGTPTGDSVGGDSLTDDQTLGDSSVDTGGPSRAPAHLSFAGAQFTLQADDGDTLTYVSDDEAAKASVATLESMGLAGSWQQAGQVKISIQNSGPAGAAVSLRFQLPAEQTLQSSSTSLATWGIDVEK